MDETEAAELQMFSCTRDASFGISDIQVNLKF